MIYKLQPIFKERIWGGSKLPQIYGYETSQPIGEAWVLSCLAKDNSPIGSGQTLFDLFKSNPDIVQKGYKGSRFPLLIKFIDAKQDLSIQVHPETKTEFWHILSPNQSQVYFGLANDSSKEQVEQYLKQGQITSLLNIVPCTAGDSFFVKPGTIHAIGKETFLIEIQQSVDETFRLYDYNRVNSEGKQRDLHIDQALYCINYHKTNVYKNLSFEHIMKCSYFNVYKYVVNGLKELEANDDSFHCVIVLENKATIINNNYTIELNQYESCFIPASSGKYQIVGSATVIVTTL